MEPVEQKESYLVNEVFADAHSGKVDQDLIADDLVLPIENEEIDLAESVADDLPQQQDRSILRNFSVMFAFNS